VCRATAIDAAGVSHTIVSSEGDAPPAGLADSMGKYVYEPDPSVVAARLVDDIAARHSLSRTAANCEYLTGNAAVTEPLLAAFEVIDVLPFDLRRLKTAQRALNIRRFEVKKRGVDVSTDTLEKKLRATEGDVATLIITPSVQGVLAVIAKRMAARDESN
jgi:hypothetical protein